MSLLPRFLQGTKAAIPIWIAFVPSSLAWGIAAHEHGLAPEEAILMSAWIYSGPAQFAVLVPLAENRPALQILLTGFLMNLRFLPMSTALAPFFFGVHRMLLFFSSHVISASSFVVPYLQFQKESRERAEEPFELQRSRGYGRLVYFLGVGVTSFVVWVSGTAAGFAAAVGFSPGFEEGLNFILPGYFAGLLVVQMKNLAVALVCALSLLAAIPGALADPDWGWITTSLLAATLVWGWEQWSSRGSRSY